MALRKTTVAAFQFKGEDSIARNLEKIGRAALLAAKAGAKLLLCHECALTGYPGVELANLRNLSPAEIAAGISALAAIAKHNQLALVCGLPLPAKPKAHNAALLFSPAGKLLLTYHKRALFTGEAKFFQPGKPAASAAKAAGIKAGLRICFDFRIPELFRELRAEGCELALVPFNMVNREYWKLEVARAHLSSRAAENGFWILSANNLGSKQNAPTCLVDPDGRIVAEAPTGKEHLLVAKIELGADTALRKDIRSEADRLMKAGFLNTPRCGQG